MQIEIKEITLHTYHNGLNKNDTLLDIRSVQNIHGDILPTIKGPWNLVLSNTPMLRQSPWVQIAHNICFCFWFTELIHKNTIRFYWFNNCVVALAGMAQWIELGLWTKGSLVQFPFKAHAWVVGQVPNRGHVRGNHTLMFLSLSFSLPLPL